MTAVPFNTLVYLKLPIIPVLELTSPDMTDILSLWENYFFFSFLHSVSLPSTYGVDLLLKHGNKILAEDFTKVT